MSWCELHECPDMACGGPHSVDYCPPQDETEIDWKTRYEATLERLEKCEAALRLCIAAMEKDQSISWGEYADGVDTARAALEE